MTPRHLLATAARVGEAVWLRTRVVAGGGLGMRACSPPADDTVRLLDPPRRGPATAAERFALLSLAHGGPMSVSDLVDRVAREIYCDELRLGGSAADIGLPGVALFRADARRAVDAGQGVLWTFGPAAVSGDPSIPG